jgi:hypothetical protein
MWKVIVLNAIIPLATFLFQILENTKVNGQRILSVKYRLWIFDYGFFLIVSQFIILMVTFFIWKKRKYRLIAIAILFVWILIYFLLSKKISLFD